METERTHHKLCQICGQPIHFGWHCEACVNEYRVCQMCNTDISHRATSAQTCDNACKEARKRGMRRTLEGMQGNVPDTQIANIQDVLAKVEALEERITKNENAVSMLVEQQVETNQQLQELNKNLSFFLTKLYDTPISQMTSRAPQARPVESASMNLDDIELEISYAGNSENNNSSWNFAISSAITVYGDFEGLPPEIIDYGLRTGRIPADAVKRKVVETIHVPLGGEQPRHTGNPKQMEVPQFAAPEFEDDSLDSFM